MKPTKFLIPGILLLGALIVVIALTLEYRSLTGGMDGSQTHLTESPTPVSKFTPSPARLPMLPLPVSQQSNEGSNATAPTPEGSSADVHDDGQHTSAPPMEVPIVYADPQKLGEVTPQQEEMYQRVIGLFAKNVQAIRAAPGSAEYRQEYQKAARAAEDHVRGLLGHDAFIRMKAAAQRGETVQESQ
jgi:hypothetical protein